MPEVLIVIFGLWLVGIMNSFTMHGLIHVLFLIGMVLTAKAFMHWKSAN